MQVVVKSLIQFVEISKGNKEHTEDGRIDMLPVDYSKVGD
jgi:hypothetical protein